MGGKQVHVDNAGSFIEPTVFDGVDNKMKIAQEEIFGPVLSVIPVKDAEQALERRQRHDLRPRLGDLDRRHQQGLQVRARACAPARCGSTRYDGGDITTPFGGYKQSGIGRDKSLHAFDKFTQLKTTWIDLS